MKGDIDELLFVSIFTITFMLITWLLVHLSGHNLSKMFRWAKHTYIVVFPISCFVLIGESIITNKWFKLRGLPVGILLMNLIIIVSLFITWLIYNKLRNKDKYYKQGYFMQKQLDQRLYVIFTIFIVVAPVVNIFNLIYFINTYLIN
jgi:hypothetical protein